MIKPFRPPLNQRLPRTGATGRRAAMTAGARRSPRSAPAPVAPSRASRPRRTADPAFLEPGLPGRAATLGDRLLAAGHKFHSMDAPDHGPYSLHARCRPCGGDSRVVPPAGHWLCDPDLPAHAV